ncbi:MAG TPA: VTT domain-containing protein [Caulobacteraceae bacterium]|jgi:uncharacterized membrane protein YdjX (TVP38/TMEM64 family)|nr:VTT domain-containing protein [Caulobacteraceae bacterium]
MSQSLRRFGLLAIVLGLLVAAMASGVWRWFSFEALQAHHAQLRHLVIARPAASAAGFVLLFVAVVASCIPGPGVMMTVGGYLFGPYVGGALDLIACVAGSALVAAACRSAFADWVARDSGPRMKAIETALRANAVSYLVSLKLIPIVPMSVTNVAAGLAGVRLRAVIAATALGSAPACFIFAGLGAGVGHGLDRGGHLDRHLMERPDVLAPLIALSVLSLAGLAWRIARRSGR